MNTRELATKFMDEILYDGDWITRWTPFNEEKHYGDWPEKFENLLEKLIGELGSDFFTDEFVCMFTCGDYDDMMDAINNHPCLKSLYEILDEYHDWLSN